MCEISIVVCTHERPRDLAGCLDSLVAIGVDAEVIVVDSASRNPCQALVDSYRDALPSLRYLYVSEPGLSRARNAGVAAASGVKVGVVDHYPRPPGRGGTARGPGMAPHTPAGGQGGGCLPRVGPPPPPLRYPPPHKH
jgi:glycosyltransferase involved in cell wall biosynthesis